jgi:Cys-tRNA(Pro) deacylase
VAKSNLPTTAAIRDLKAQGCEFIIHAYPYEDRGGTKVAAKALGVDEHCIIKTLVMETENRSPLIILMHGDREVSTKMLARALGVKAVTPCNPKIAEKHTGYKVGGTSPYGTKGKLPIYMEISILSLPAIFINAGSRGLLAEMPPQTLAATLQPTPVSVAI